MVPRRLVCAQRLPSAVDGTPTFSGDVFVPQSAAETFFFFRDPPAGGRRAAAERAAGSFCAETSADEAALAVPPTRMKDVASVSLRGGFQGRHGRLMPAELVRVEVGARNLAGVARRAFLPISPVALTSAIVGRGAG